MWRPFRRLRKTDGFMRNALAIINSSLRSGLRPCRLYGQQRRREHVRHIYIRFPHGPVSVSFTGDITITGAGYCVMKIERLTSVIHTRADNTRRRKRESLSASCGCDQSTPLRTRYSF